MSLKWADIALTVRPVIPKVHSPSDVHFVIDMIQKHAHPDTRDSLKLIASIESAKAIMNLKEVRA